MDHRTTDLPQSRTQSWRRNWIALALLGYLATACMTAALPDISRHRWWSGLGPVLPHDSFPADCSLCHEGQDWNQLREDFTFDHEAETGYALKGAHDAAMCLRCHNDRGPAGDFARMGCSGCHGDTHQGDLGPRCDTCHTERDWRPVGQVELHARTRFPLVGVHSYVACHRCHPGAAVGNFVPNDPRCETCHQADLAAANNPPHINLGWVDDCQRCHIPTAWNQAVRR